MNNRYIPLLLAVVSAVSLYGTTVRRSFRNGYPAEAKSATVKGKSNPLAQPAKGAKSSPVGAVDDSDWQKGPTEQWFVNWDKALAEAEKKNKPLFVLNTGSDWCHWCKKLHEEVLEKPEFVDFAKKELVLLYLDSPSRNPLGRAQKLHNRRVVKALQFGGGVPCVVIVSAKGRKLGMIGGGGQTVDAYLEKMRSILDDKKGKPLEDGNAKVLFSAGYGALAEKLDAELAALPPVKKEDFKAKLTGVAIIDNGNWQIGEKAKFGDPADAIEVPFGKAAYFRIEYDFPTGYQARVWARCRWPQEQRENYRYFGSNPSPLYAGKGVAYGFLTMMKEGKNCTLENLILSTNSEPELEEFPHGWALDTASVNITFRGEGADGNGANEATPAKPVTADEKVPAKINDAKWRKGPDRLWFVNWNKALKEAKKTKKKLFVLNTGSDWCGWCKKLRAEVLGSSKFKSYARKNLVLVYLDSPRKKPLPDDQQQHNRDVASRLNFGGGVPCAKIVDPDGEQVLETISGYRPEKEYLQLVKDAVGK